MNRCRILSNSQVGFFGNRPVRRWRLDNTLDGRIDRAIERAISHLHRLYGPQYTMSWHVSERTDLEQLLFISCWIVAFLDLDRMRRLHVVSFVDFDRALALLLDSRRYFISYIFKQLMDVLVRVSLNHVCRLLCKSSCSLFWGLCKAARITRLRTDY